MSIRLERVAFAYSDRVPLLAGVDLHLTMGPIGIVGENGAGKSTLLALIRGDLTPTAGRVLVDAAIESVDQLDGDAPASPGERRLARLREAFAAQPAILLLDEPTNHLDDDARAYLVHALRRFRGLVALVSHDRELLDACAAIVRVHAGGARLYTGNYTQARAIWEADEAFARSERGDAQRAAKAAKRRLDDARRDQRAADHSRKKRKKSMHDHDASSMNRSISRGWAEDRLGRSVEVLRRAATRADDAVPDAPPLEVLGRSIFVDYQRCPRRVVLERGARFVGPASRIRIAGGNGAGKTTLLRQLLASRPRDHILYLPQENVDVPDVRALPADVRGRVLSLVAALGCEPERVLATSSPSPGEARKLALAMGMGQHAWCLVLDEPTNHLDLPSIERLEAALAAYPGALVLVSHDDAFAARVTTETWHM